VVLVILLLFLAWQVWRSRPALPPPPTGGWSEPEAQAATRGTDNLVYAGLPKPVDPSLSILVLKRRGYWAGYSEFRRNPLWVGYRLDPERGRTAGPRPGGFRTDPETASKVDEDEYNGTGYDRGHMAPNSAIASRFGEEGQIQTFLMSNICPQRPELNRRVWERIERLEDDTWANRLGTVWVIAGPVFDGNRSFLESRKRKTEIEIPDAFYKIIVREAPEDVRLLAFRVPQEVAGPERPEQFLTTVDAIERETGLDFFSALSDARENRLEAERPTALWAR